MTVKFTCKKCGEDKPSEDFHWRKTENLVWKIRKPCKACQAKCAKIWRTSNLECARLSCRDWRAEKARETALSRLIGTAKQRSSLACGKMRKAQAEALK
jgi:hypothetical protein